MKLEKIYDSTGNPQTGTILSTPVFFNKSRYLAGSVQIVVNGGSGNITTQGRALEYGAYGDVHSATAASKTFPGTCAVLPWMRVRITSAVNLEVEVWILRH